MEVYTDPKHKGSLGGVDRFAIATHRPRSTAKAQLSAIPAYSLHKQIRRKFPRRRYQVSGIDHLWQADLADFSHMWRQNGGFRFVLFMIDVFSKFLWVEPIKNKRSISTLAALQAILARSEPRRPLHVMTDKGGEFVLWKDYLGKHLINYYTAENAETKASVAERSIRTIKSRIYRYFTATGKKRWVDQIQNIVKVYNHTRHRSIKTEPINVTKDTEDQVRETLYGQKDKNTVKKGNLKVGDFVRISKYKNVFGKGYAENWTREIFKIVHVKQTDPPVYELRDLQNEKILGTFYEPEMQKIENQ